MAYVAVHTEAEARCEQQHDDDEDAEPVAVIDLTQPGAEERENSGKQRATGPKVRVRRGSGHSSSFPFKVNKINEQGRG